MVTDHRITIKSEKLCSLVAVYIKTWTDKFHYIHNSISLLLSDCIGFVIRHYPHFDLLFSSHEKSLGYGEWWSSLCSIWYHLPGNNESTKSSRENNKRHSLKHKQTKLKHKMSRNSYGICPEYYLLHN